MSAVDEVFERCREQRRAAFIPYLTAGDPDLEMTAQLLEAVVRGGADIIELGVPFSDPMADGPVIQRACVRSLESGTTLSGILELVARVRPHLGVPVILFSYFNPILAYGVERFADQAAESGVDGILCLDLPPEEAAEQVGPVLADRGLDSIYLLAPTSSRARVRQVDEASSGFVYYVSRTGVTGAQEALDEHLLKDAKKLRKRLRLPLAVGFGISTPEQVEAVSRVADGVVVGSALVSVIEESSADRELPRRVEEKVRRLSAPLLVPKRFGSRFR